MAAGEITGNITRRTGAQTRVLASRIALRLFTEQGYEATSLRQIADELGINKASLYYYFDSKEAIVRSLLNDRGDEAEQLLQWLHEQPRTPGLLTAAVLRWVESFSIQKLQGIRFMAANPLIARTLADHSADDRIGATLTAFAHQLAELLPQPTPETVVLLRMAVLSINASVQASAHTQVPDEAIINAARRAAAALLAEITHSTQGRPPQEVQSSGPSLRTVTAHSLGNDDDGSILVESDVTPSGTRDRKETDNSGR